MKNPERINLLRLSDLVLSSSGKLDISRGLFSLGPEADEEEEDAKSFSFDAGNAPIAVAAAAAAPAPVLDFAEMAKKGAAFDLGTTSPSKAEKYTGIAKHGKAKSATKRSPKVDDLTKAMARANLK